MKKLVLTIFALAAFSASNAQGADTVKFGVKAGVQFTNFAGDDAGFGESWDPKTGFFIGGLVDLPVSGNFHVQPELLYSMEGATVGDTGAGELDYGVSYLRIPVMAKYYIIQGLSLQAGPEIAFKIGTAEDYADDAIKSMDFGIGAGAGYELPMGLMFDIRYNLGLSNISDLEDREFNNTGVQLGVGYRF